MKLHTKYVSASVPPEVYQLKTELKDHVNFSKEVAKLIVRLHNKHLLIRKKLVKS
jgi:hypothetical protein